MSAHCTSSKLEFARFFNRQVTARFDGGRMSSDGGAIVLREVEQTLNLFERLTQCFTDYRNPRRCEHRTWELLAQRIYGIALGYEDLNDHDQLRFDSVLALLCDKPDVLGSQRKRRHDVGVPLAGSSTLNRLELGVPGQAAGHRYKKIVGDEAAMDHLLVEIFLESHDEAPEQIWLDLDATDDLAHGHQEGIFYHGYYDGYCYLPLYIFCDGHLLCARLRPSRIDACAGADEELARIVAQIRQTWPDTRIVLRADSGFCRQHLMRWCEQNGVYYLFGLARNRRLQRRISKPLAKSRRRCRYSGQPARRFVQFHYRTRRSWSCARQVIAKAEVLPKGDNPRFVVTNLPRTMTGSIQHLYEQLYCARGDAENRIKEQQLCLFADRTSTSLMRANQLRLYFSSFAYVLLHAFRRLALRGSRHEKAQCSTLRVRFLKIATRIQVTTRRVWLSMSESYPWQHDFEVALQQLRTLPCRSPPA